ncbi:MAG TPA: cupin domain-containing protein [Nitrososphaera sp.]|nr:cupin domain-containing protein [Nitrososphaera sp.]
MNREAARWIARLKLKKHPEGGFYRETYRAKMELTLPGFEGSRNACSSIYYLLADDQISAFHRIKSDEIWHHYAGGSLVLYKLEKDEKKKMKKTLDRLSRINLGNGPRETPQAVIESGCWVAASVRSGDFCLVGCTVAPGFDFRDWELGTKSQLVAQFPAFRKTIEKYTAGTPSATTTTTTTV